MTVCGSMASSTCRIRVYFFLGASPVYVPMLKGKKALCDDLANRAVLNISPERVSPGLWLPSKDRGGFSISIASFPSMLVKVALAHVG